MPRKKYPHNTKSLKRYKKNELKQFIKDNDLPFKVKSKMTKNEIVVALLKLQKSGYSKCFCKLELKGPRKLSKKQQENLKRLQEANKARLLKMKNKVGEEQKIDKKKEPEPLPVKVNEKPTELEVVVNQPLIVEGEGIQGIGMNLDQLFDRANKMDESQMNENLSWVEEEIFGKQEEPIKEEQKEQPIEQADKDFFERELGDVTLDTTPSPEKKDVDSNDLRIRLSQLNVEKLNILFRMNNMIPSRYPLKQQKINGLIENVPAITLRDQLNIVEQSERS